MTVSPGGSGTSSTVMTTSSIALSRVPSLTTRAKEYVPAFVAVNWGLTSVVLLKAIPTGAVHW